MRELHVHVNRGSFELYLQDSMGNDMVIIRSVIIELWASIGESTNKIHPVVWEGNDRGSGRSQSQGWASGFPGRILGLGIRMVYSKAKGHYK